MDPRQLRAGPAPFRAGLADRRLHVDGSSEVTSPPADTLPGFRRMRQVQGQETHDADHIEP